MIKKVMCNDSRDCQGILTSAQVYEVVEETQYYYCLLDVAGIWRKMRFHDVYPERYLLPGIIQPDYGALA